MDLLEFHFYISQSLPALVENITYASSQSFLFSSACFARRCALDSLASVSGSPEFGTDGFYYTDQQISNRCALETHICLGNPIVVPRIRDIVFRAHYTLKSLIRSSNSGRSIRRLEKQRRYDMDASNIRMEFKVPYDRPVVERRTSGTRNSSDSRYC